jgi:predicted SAM-dependent methyltransferase
LDKESRVGMRRKLNEFSPDSDHIKVLDIGSYDVNGNFRQVIPIEWEYKGVDIVDGPNVDIIMPSEYKIPVKDNSIDIIISGSCFQYVKNPFKLTKEMVRCLKIGGITIINAPRQEKEGLIGLPKDKCVNQDPTFDCWRILKDGMRAILEDSELDVVEVSYTKNLCWGVGRKKN